MRSRKPDSTRDSVANARTREGATEPPEAFTLQLHEDLGQSYIVSREWNRTNLTILDTECEPVVLVEANAMATFDVLN